LRHRKLETIAAPPTFVAQIASAGGGTIRTAGEGLPSDLTASCVEAQKPFRFQNAERFGTIRAVQPLIRFPLMAFAVNADLYNGWRKLEGLPVAPTYFEAKSGKQHGS
jgi:hypothetical protein